ncbi:ISBma1, transposase [Burkholderia pseudomallei]|uniref:hypothetical protein n=1 Tax=Burkholderia pseudomallei TaxID=28450 RepID=UPI000F255443|nr:hypothetical protein [Burkholderia pseudomallei]VBL71898.1 ISBma1, transposase [Burkholderia pseudomallei]
MIELQTELARVLRRRQEEIQVPGRRYMANETYLLESGGCAFVPMATLVAAANAGPSDCIDAFRASIEAIVARHVEPTWQGACMAVTCLISSGHFNLGERPRLLQLNNTAA